jgi:hypothetical protein
MHMAFRPGVPSSRRQRFAQPQFPIIRLGSTSRNSRRVAFGLRPQSIVLATACISAAAPSGGLVSRLIPIVTANPAEKPGIISYSP